uniref:Selenoprotein F n=1 Tax=Callithrix jacchus TaxID=9483 RepID=A0A8I3WC05_CALJA
MLRDGGRWRCKSNSGLQLSEEMQRVSAFGAEFSSEACRELGFSSNLLCSSCDLLGQFNLLQLDPDCRGCCQEEAQFETKKIKQSKYEGKSGSHSTMMIKQRRSRLPIPCWILSFSSLPHFWPNEAKE